MNNLRTFAISFWLALLAVGCEQRHDPAAIPPDPVPPAAVTGQSQELKKRPEGIIPSFRMLGPESGFDFERYDDLRGLHRILEVNGGGTAIVDFDRDGWLDVFMTNGCRLPLKQEQPETRCEFFANTGGMRFRNITDATGLIQHGQTHGCAVGDYDNDGFEDLYVTAYGRNAMWRNNGDGTFTDVTAGTATDVPAWSSSAAFADVNGDGNLDLYVVNYLQESDESPRLCPKPGSPDGYEQCPPAMFEGADDVLFLSDGSGRFLDATEFAGISHFHGKGLGVVISDLDQDGLPEIFVANDGQANFLFSPMPTLLEVPSIDGSSTEIRGFKYVERALLSSIALSEAGYAQANMGIAAGDHDASGTIDLLITHFYADTTTLYSNLGDLLFTDATRASRLGAPSRNRLGWGAAFCDFDNNGWLDLIVANGHIDDRTWMQHGEPYQMRAQIFRNDERGSFSDVSDWCGPYFQKEWLGRGLAVGDLDRDGKMDAVISNQLAPSYLLQNDTQNAGRSLVLRFIGTSSNRDGYGVRVKMTEGAPLVVREVTGGGSFQSASVTELHLGMGNMQSAALAITWPSGITETPNGLRPGRYVLIEGRGCFSGPHLD